MNTWRPRWRGARRWLTHKVMRNGLAEILATGIAPGFNTKAVDGALPEKAVPKAFKDLENKHSADRIARDAGFSVKQIKRIWNI